MNHINLDTLPEPFQRLIHTMAAAPDGSVLEKDGKPVIRVTPLPGPDGTADGEWTPAMNRRRSELIDRKIDGSISPEERAELQDLQDQLGRYVDRVAPLPWEPLRKLHQELLEKAARAAPSS